MPYRFAAGYLVLCTAALLGCDLARRERMITRAAQAARQGDTATLKALAAAGHDLNAVDPGLNHWTPLMHAIHKGQRTTVDALIAMGVDVNRTTKSGLSALEMAAGDGQAHMVRHLLDAGADPREPGVFVAAVGSCNDEVVNALLKRAPDLRLPYNARGNLTRLYARLNQCHSTLRLAGS